MKNIFLAVLVFLLSMTLISYSQNKKMMDMKNKGDKEVVTGKGKMNAVKEKVDTTNVVVNTVCPVSGEMLEDNDHNFTYKGKTYGVCCNKCLTKIKKDPEKYISKLTPDGKSLIKNN